MPELKMSLELFLLAPVIHYRFKKRCQERGNVLRPPRFPVTSCADPSWNFNNFCSLLSFCITFSTPEYRRLRTGLTSTDEEHSCLRAPFRSDKNSLAGLTPSTSRATAVVAGRDSVSCAQGVFFDDILMLVPTYQDF